MWNCIVSGLVAHNIADSNRDMASYAQPPMSSHTYIQMSNLFVHAHCTLELINKKPELSDIIIIDHCNGLSS